MSDILSEFQPAIAVDSTGGQFSQFPYFLEDSPILAVGRLVHRSRHQLALTLPRKFNPSPVVAARHLLPGLLSGQSSNFLIHLNEEDAWVLSRGLLLVRFIRPAHTSLY